MDWNPQVTSIHDLKISGFVPHTDVRKDGILFSAVVPEGAEASLLLYEKGSEKVKCEIPFPEDFPRESLCDAGVRNPCGSHGV